MTDGKKEKRVNKDEKITPARRFFVMTCSWLRCSIAEGRYPSILKKLERARDNPKRQNSPERETDMIVAKGTRFDTNHALEVRQDTINPFGRLQDVLDEMREVFWAEIKFKPDKNQTKLTKEGIIPMPKGPVMQETATADATPEPKVKVSRKK